VLARLQGAGAGEAADTLASRAATSLDQLETLVRSRLRAIQRRLDLINAFLGQTGLTVGTKPP